MTDQQGGHWPEELGREARALTRRDLLRRAGTGLAVTGAAALLGPWDTSSGAATPHASSGTRGLAKLPGGTPRRGGTFTVGVPSAGSAENLFPGTLSITPDYVRGYNLYNLLFYVGRNVTPIEPGLAVSAESNADATLWTFHLRDGVLFHDGKPFDADDVVYNFRSLWSSSALNYSNGFLVGLVDFKGVRKRDRLTVEVPLLKPCAQFPGIFTFYNFGIVQNGATKESTAKHPIGTGPFKYKSFQPGSRSEFVRFPDYWEHGKPYVDTLVVDSSFVDNSALTNALISGQINLLPNVPLLTAKNQLQTKQVQILEAPIAAIQYMFLMRVDKGQFADNRVRTAFKLLADRQALVDGAFAGFGSPAYDLLAPGTEYFLSHQTRKPDPKKAKSLLKQAGMQDHTFVLPVAEVFPGMVEAATLFAQQAQAAGVKVVVEQTNVGTYFTPAGGFTTRTFGMEVNQVVPSLTGDYLAEITTGCPYPDTQWGKQTGGAASEKLIFDAIGELNKTKAAALWRECQLQQFNEGGYLIWGNVPIIDGAAQNIRGLTAGSGFNYNNWRLCDGWIES
jgi:peptide/nickel transport system substrate-binding protein